MFPAWIEIIIGHPTYKCRLQESRSYIIGHHFSPVWNNTVSRQNGGPKKPTPPPILILQYDSAMMIWVVSSDHQLGQHDTERRISSTSGRCCFPWLQQEVLHQGRYLMPCACANSNFTGGFSIQETWMKCVYFSCLFPQFLWYICIYFISRF